MKYSIVLIKNDPNFSAQTLAEVDTPQQDPVLEQRLETAIFASVQTVVEQHSSEQETGVSPISVSASWRGRKPKEVCVLSFDDPEYAPAGLRTGQRLRSTNDLSRLLGFKYNAVVQAFHRESIKRVEEANKLKDPIEKQTKLAERLEPMLRGCHFCYVEDLAPATE